MKKYDLIREGNLFRIIALKDFNGVKKGYFGGVVENRNNLGQQGDCWIHENAKVTGKAEVRGNALVSGDAEVTGNALVFGYAKVLNKGFFN